MIRILIIVLGGLLAYSVFKRMLAWSGRAAASQEDERLGRLLQDPQCGIYVDGQEAVRRKVKGGDLFFCSEKCAKEFMSAQREG